MNIVVTLANGSSTPFSIDGSGRGRPFFVLGVRKCGSTLLNKVCSLLARANSKPFVDVAGTFFRNDVNAGGWMNDPAVRKILRPGNVYGGFRNMPICLKDTAAFVNAGKLLMVRDPRDALVSEYFSNAFSHLIPNTDDGAVGASANLLAQREKALGSTIDGYVRGRAKLMRRTFLEYADIWSDPDILRLRYEEIIFDKPKLVGDIVSHFRWTCSDDMLSNIVEQVDIRVEVENPKSFVRRVTPGDHREKLSQQTIEFLNSELTDVLTHYGYEN
jgi:hypothetical protein